MAQVVGYELHLKTVCGNTPFGQRMQCRGVNEQIERPAFPGQATCKCRNGIQIRHVQPLKPSLGIQSERTNIPYCLVSVLLIFVGDDYIHAILHQCPGDGESKATGSAGDYSQPSCLGGKIVVCPSGEGEGHTFRLVQIGYLYAFAY